MRRSGFSKINIETIALVTASIAILSSALHFWPFEKSRLYQTICPMNLAVIIWVVILGIRSIKTRKDIGRNIPHISVFAYLLLNVLSLGFSPDIGRSVNFVIKLGLGLVGAYTMFNFAVSDAKRLKIFYKLSAIALLMAVCSGFLGRFLFGYEGFGFFRSAYKYGSYVGQLALLCVVFYLWNNGRRIVGFILILLILAAFQAEGFKSAISMTEKDNINLKQRYIEWQAELNLLEERAAEGTGAGCINEYRSEFYFRLPKLNTLKPFDQNGWVATAAETGFMGLVCFCWIIGHYFKLGWSSLKMARAKPECGLYGAAIANFTALIGACVANIFSSVQYNGVLIVFVFILALTAKTQRLLTEAENANP